jgi:hypothetical protein
MSFRFSNHALEEMKKRKVPISFVETVLENPQQTLQQDEEITIYSGFRLDEVHGEPPSPPNLGGSRVNLSRRKSRGLKLRKNVSH